MKNQTKTILSLLVAFGLGTFTGFCQRPDIVINDFEGSDYGTWTPSDSAFGSRSAYGTLPGQMKVEGYQGQGLVNSFNGGDDSTGKLISPSFKIERKYIQFLIGGGGWEGRTCMNLRSGNKIVRTATGPNVVSGGSEKLEPAQWDVSDFQGKEVWLEIEDNAKGTWGHINVDHIIQSDTRINAPVVQRDVTREIIIDKPHLNLPVKNGAPTKRVTLSVDRTELHGFDIELADGDPDWWAFFDATSLKGKTVTVKVNKLVEGSKGLSSIDQSKEIKDAGDLYREPLRPQFHFTARRGWLNDPNGLVYFQGEYHLFFQHNPYGWNWGNMHWGHAVSKDLVHWKELPEALYPDEHGTMYSGSAVVDWNNTGGFKSGKDPALVAMFTAAGHPFTQGIAYSNDRGRTWTKYENNPVLGHIAAENRDPKLVWYAPENKWVIPLYLDHNDFAFYSSTDLKQWTKLSDFKLPDDSECPNFFSLPLDGNTNQQRWVFFGANGVYSVGQFNGREFAPQTQPQRLHHGNCWYAAQVFSDIPAKDSRCILIPWGRLPDGEIFRGMKFNQMMGLPVELTLHLTDANNASIKVTPARELAALRQRTHEIKPQRLNADSNPLDKITADLVEIEAVLKVGSEGTVTFDLHGVPVVYNMEDQKLSCAGQQVTYEHNEGRISLHLYVDRRAVDIFGNDGRLYMPMAMRMLPTNHTLKLSSKGTAAEIVSLKVHELKSAW